MGPAAGGDAPARVKWWCGSSAGVEWPKPAPQTSLDALVVQNALSAKRPTLGESILKAKLQISDVDVRRTYVLLGDSAMLVKQPGIGSGH